jgi:hypothetical protein
MSKETLGIVLALVIGIVSLGLWVMDKAGKNTATITIGALLLITALSLCLVYLVPWLWDSQSIALKIWRVCFATALVLLSMGRFGIWVWPMPIGTMVHNTDEIKPLLNTVPDPTYRDLVAEIIHEMSPTSRVSIGTLLTTPDGSRTVDVEVVSIGEKNRLIADIDIVDLPSGRAAGVEVIDAADSKRLDIKADVMLVCSNTGFDAVAIQKAKRKKIGAISILRQGDKRVKAVIEEEVYLRDVDITPLKMSYTGATPGDLKTLQSLLKGTHDLTYQGGSVDGWLEQKAMAAIMVNPYAEGNIRATFSLKEPTDFDIKGRAVKLTGFSMDLQPRVKWLSQTIQLDATSSIYDYVRRRPRFGSSGTHSLTLKGIDYDKAKPLSSPPQITDLGLGLFPLGEKLAPGEIDVSLVRLKGLDLTDKIKIAKLDDLVRPEDLDMRIK